jgi:hypothetical protein
MPNLTSFSTAKYSSFYPWLIVGLLSIPTLGLTGCDAYQEVYQQGYNQGYQTGKQEGFSSGEKKGYKTGKKEGYDLGKAEGFATGKEKGFQEGFDVGKDEGYQLGNADGYQKGKRDGQLNHVFKFGALGLSLGLILSSGSVLLITRRWWLEHLSTLKRQIEIKLMVGKWETPLEQELYEQVLNLSKYINQVQHLASNPRFSLGAQSIKQTLDNLLNKKIIRLAILLQEQKNNLAIMEPSSQIVESIKLKQEMLATTEGKVHNELEKVIAEESKKLTSVKNTEERIKSYQFQLSNYYNLLDNFVFSIKNLHTSITEGEIREEKIEQEINYLINAFNQVDPDS